MAARSEWKSTDGCNLQACRVVTFLLTGAKMFAKMILRRLVLLLVPACLVAGCDESVRLIYFNRADAEAEDRFARGWLPEIIPPSSREISMRNNLDLNTSTGEFSFDPSDYDAFVSQLERVPSRDEGEFSAYVYEDWFFWFHGGKSYCRFRMVVGSSAK